jgi:sterol 3beta-glucosyltransferase
MRITIVAVGSLGDVQPCVALGEGLLRSGLTVRIATYRTFADLVSKHGLEFAPVAGDPRQAMQDRSGQRWLESGRSFLSFIRRLRSLSTFESLRDSLDDTTVACQGSDAILYTPLGAAGYHVAEAMGVPTIYLVLQPVSRSRKTPSIFMPSLPLGGAYNRLTYFLVEQMLWQAVRVPFNQWRQETLGLDPMGLSGPFDRLYRDKQIFLYGFSERVVPRRTDWPEWHHTTGYWFLRRQESWSPPADLVTFLSKGPMPISIGFGSMTGQITRRLADLAIRAVQKSGQRAVLLGGWAPLGQVDLPASICALEFAPHEWLFPRMAAVVHHGGAGTTAAGLRAGVPSVLVPFFGDQPFWGRRVHALGVGTRPIMRSRLTVQRLTEAIARATTDQAMQARASRLGEEIRSEDGVANAVEIVRATLLEKDVPAKG